MDHLPISGNEPSSVILSQTKLFHFSIFLKESYNVGKVRWPLHMHVQEWVLFTVLYLAYSLITWFKSFLQTNWYEVKAYGNPMSYINQCF